MSRLREVGPGPRRSGVGVSFEFLSDAQAAGYGSSTGAPSAAELDRFFLLDATIAVVAARASQSRAYLGYFDSRKRQDQARERCLAHLYDDLGNNPDTTDAAERREGLQFIRQWLGTDPDTMAGSLRTFVGHPGYDLAGLRDDLARFTFLLGGDPGEHLDPTLT